MKTNQPTQVSIIKICQPIAVNRGSAQPIEITATTRIEIDWDKRTAVLVEHAVGDTPQAA